MRGNSMPRTEGRSLKKLQNMAARLRERVAFGNCMDSKNKAIERLKYVEKTIKARQNNDKN